MSSCSVLESSRSSAQPASAHSSVPGFTLSGKAPIVALNFGKTAAAISAFSCSEAENCLGSDDGVSLRIMGLVVEGGKDICSLSGLKLQYLRGDFSKMVTDIFTFYWFSERDSKFFFEMIALLIIFAVLSYIVSRSVSRTILNIIIGFYGSMFLAGIQFFGVAPRTKAVFKIHTVFRNHILLSLIYFTAVIIAFSICFAPEIKTLFKRDFKPLLISLICAFCTAFTALFVLSIKWKPLHVADFILLTVLWTVLVSSFVVLKKGTTLPGNRFFPALFSAFSLILILGMIFKTGVFAV